MPQIRRQDRTHMEKLIERGLLFDHYGGLLSEKNRKLCEASVSMDMSLSELSEEFGISRQAVSEKLQRIDRKLSGYEDELGLVRRSERLGLLAEELRQAADSKSVDRNRLRSIADEMTEV